MLLSICLNVGEIRITIFGTDVGNQLFLLTQLLNAGKGTPHTGMMLQAGGDFLQLDTIATQLHL